MARLTTSGPVTAIVAASLFAGVLTQKVQAADAAEGERLARRTCSSCHSFTGNRPSAMPAAPAFTSISRSPRFKKDGAALLLRSHIQMPNFAFTADEAENIAAFIRTLGRSTQ